MLSTPVWANEGSQLLLIKGQFTYEDHKLNKIGIKLLKNREVVNTVQLNVTGGQAKLETAVIKG